MTMPLQVLDPCYTYRNMRSGEVRELPLEREERHLLVVPPLKKYLRRLDASSATPDEDEWALCDPRGYLHYWQRMGPPQISILPKGTIPTIGSAGSLQIKLYRIEPLPTLFWAHTRCYEFIRSSPRPILVEELGNQIAAMELARLAWAELREFPDTSPEVFRGAQILIDEESAQLISPKDFFCFLCLVSVEWQIRRWEEEWAERHCEQLRKDLLRLQGKLDRRLRRAR
jgi:hypothetical protein